MAAHQLAHHENFILLIEDNPTQHGRSGTVRQLEYACVATTGPQGLRLVVKGVRDTNTHEEITDLDNLPPLASVLEAAKLYDWCWHNQAVFSPGLPMVDGNIFRSRPPRPDQPQPR